MDRLAETCERVAGHSSRLKKVAILAEYLRPLSDADFERAVRFLCCGPIVSGGERKFSLGGATLREALAAACGWDGYILNACYNAVGDTGETVSLLMRGQSRNEPMTLADAEMLYARLYKSRRTADRVELLRDIYTRYRPDTLKYFVKVITGNLRIGLLARTVEEAVAVATGVPGEEVRTANNRAGDLPKIALAARRGALHEMEARLFHPMDFMLAKPLDVLSELADPAGWWVEDKYDGFRSQVHVSGGEVRIFTRGGEEVTSAFPEIADAFRNLQDSAVFDGEILAWREGRALSFNLLQQRIARKKLSASLMEDVPVVFIAYDLLFCGQRMMVDRPVEERRLELTKMFDGQELPLMIAPQWIAETTDELERAFVDAKARGNEGLILKQRGSLYEPGKRTGRWLKVKRPYGTLDVVITAAETGSGKRAIYLSDYTFAVRDGDRFLNVGKAYSGLTDVEVRELTRLLRSIATERFGKVTLVQPQVVIEVAFDGIQHSPRHKSGFALRFPRIVRWRKDKKAEDADTLARVKEMYEASLSGG